MTATLREEPVFVGDFEPGSPEWHSARAKGIGGSEVAAVLGLSPWESRFSLWHRKSGLASPVVENDVMYWGKQLEPAILAEWNKRHTVPDSMTAQHAGTWSHYRYPWMVANPDGLIYPLVLDTDDQRPDALLEIKTAYSPDGWGTEGTDEIPVYYRTQCLWYLDVFGLDVCHLAVLISGSDYREYRIEYDADEAAFMRDRCRAFLDDVETGKRPDIDGSDATYQVIREMHPDIDDVPFEVPAALAVPYVDAIAAHKAAEVEKKRTAAELLAAMGTARRAFYLGEQIAMRVPNGKNPPYLKANPEPKPTTTIGSAA